MIRKGEKKNKNLINKKKKLINKNDNLIKTI